MKAFEVRVNGERVGTAGVGRNGVLSVVVNWAGGSPPRSRRGFELRLGGLDSTSGEFLDWETPAVGVGDEITIKIHETKSIDPPSERGPRATKSVASLIEQVRSLEDILVQTCQTLINEFPESPEAKAAVEISEKLKRVQP